MIILGLNIYHPDASACLLKDGRLIAAIEEGRLVRIKHWAGFPLESIKYCLREANLSLQDIDYIALNRDPKANMYKKLIFTITNRPSLSLFGDRLGNLSRLKETKNILSRHFSVPVRNINAKVFYIEHHRAHLGSSFFVSPFEKASVVSVDGFGDFSSCMVARGQKDRLDFCYEVNYPHSLGIFYTAFTQFLGFSRFGDEYKVMGLSAFGKPKYLREMEKILILKPKGKFSLDTSYLPFFKKGIILEWENREPSLQEAFSEKFIKKFGPPRKYNEEVSSFHTDIAASVQLAYENAFFHILNYAYKLNSIPYLCLAGGCVQNSLANGKISNNTSFKQVYIQPAASDSGGALGAAYYLYNQILVNKREFVMENAYWGPGFDDDYIGRGIESCANRLSGCSIERIADQNMLCRKIAGFISEGKIIGWFQGRMEWGPRALGNRSILADPRRKEIKSILNNRIKKREWFRPFAPAILIEKFGDYFKESSPDHFMSSIYPVRETKKKVIPAVTHVDGTARPQVVIQKDNPLFWQLIKEFESLTGVPVILNTSFNENEPIVCTPKDA
ncbi:MAG: carbamoyltransferase, partial [Candidatus Omnitrophica bacterium]|nr:carbamoyltransferase [Candidatus Omnitrophota bacterium]